MWLRGGCTISVKNPNLLENLRQVYLLAGRQPYALSNEL